MRVVPTFLLDLMEYLGQGNMLSPKACHRVPLARLGFLYIL